MEPQADETCGRTLQPDLSDLVSCVNAPSLVLSASEVQIDEGGVQGRLYAVDAVDAGGAARVDEAPA